MNLEEIQGFIQDNYPIQQFIGWTPSEYDMKYKYNTERKQKKIVNEKVKQDNILHDKINEQISTMENLKLLCCSIDQALPHDVSSLFFYTISWNFNDLIDRHTRYLDKQTELKSKYLNNNFHCIYNWIYKIQNCEKIKYSGEVDIEKFKELFKDCIKDTDLSIYTQKYCNQILKDYLEFKELEKNDVVLKYQSKSECERYELKNIVDKIYNITNEIKLALDNKQITHWEREANWGVGGYYNGILKNIDNKRVSFKSFVAGGYNIQRRHIRCRLTVLKNKE